MKMLQIILIFSSIILPFIKSDDPLTENGVFILNQNNFDKFIRENSVVLVEFYAPWCGHCKSFAPIYSEAAERLSQFSIPLTKVDVTVETTLAEEYHINGYPTLKYFKNGHPYDFEADRNVDEIIKVMKYISSHNWIPPKRYVITLTKENFTEVTRHSDYILVEFFAPWCGHCKTLAPEYEKAAKKLSKHDQPMTLAVVDAITEPELAREYNVTGYPTLKLIRYGRVREYNGPRHSDGIVEWMVKNRADSAKEINSKSALNNIKNPEKVLVLGLFQSKEDRFYNTFIDACNQLRDDILSAYSFNGDIHKLYNVDVKDNISSILLLKPEYFVNRYESDYTKYVSSDASETSVAELVSFIEKNLLTLVGEFNKETAVSYERFQKEYLCLFFYTVNFSVHHRQATKMWLEKIIEIASNYQEKIQFAIADDEKQFEQLKGLRLDDSGEEMNVGCITQSNVKYRMPPMDEFDKDHIHKFLSDMLEDKIFPLLKSSPIPKLMSSGIKPVVGDTYKKMVNDDPTEALILVYRSPCEECDVLKKLLQGLASKLNQKVFNLFSMDMSLNEFPPIEGLDSAFKGTTIYFIKSVKSHAEKLLKKKLVKFTGDTWNESDIRSFITQNSDDIKDEL